MSPRKTASRAVSRLLAAMSAVTMPADEVSYASSQPPTTSARTRPASTDFRKRSKSTSHCSSSLSQ